jgi:hypothetical protein
VKPDAYRGPPPSEGQFREFVSRLLRVPKREIDEREKARKRRQRESGDAKIKPG